MKKKGNEVDKIKQPWPTKRAMEQIYEKKLWGDNSSHFYSGEGSHHPEIVIPYLQAVTSFLGSFESLLTVCDLGCGDFNVGKELVPHTNKYVAIDIVPELIAYNKEHFKAKNLEFYCKDIAVNNLPSVDCVLLRQVLQHLSNAEVQAVLNKLTSFKYIILTEHIPQEDFIPNKEIISGQGTRLKKQSGLNILESPFNFNVIEEKELISIILKENKGVIVTTLYTVF